MPSQNPSSRLLRACALFGISPTTSDHEQRQQHARAAARQLQHLPPGQIAFITGPSGSGKSLIIRELAAALGPAALHLDPLQHHRWRKGSVIDQFRVPLAVALGSLSRAGLADATILSADPRHLSDGQRYRLLLALCASQTARKKPPLRDTAPPNIPPPHTPLLLLDEFCSSLDRTTARNIARTLRRLVRTTQIRLICASANDDLLEPLAPDILVYQPIAAPPIIVARASRSHPANIAL